jgi:spore germination cell wall hydrolase CwlJ-like protein
MSRKTFSIAAIATVAVATTMFPSGQYAAALAANLDAMANDPFAMALVAEPAELVPEQPTTPITFVSQEVVQPLPEAESAPVPVLTEAGSLIELMRMVDTAAPMSDEMRCLAGAVYFEARGEPLTGQLAVAQVIINRSEDGRFPRSYCGVVAQPGQFSFMRGKQMPAIRSGTAAWTRAVAIAEIAHKGLWESEADDAVFFHANYVRPSWSHRKTRLAQIDTHIFYR